jgi:UDP-N-acetylglucosamine 2-epimerase
MKVVTIVGARPQFIKAAPVSRALRHRHEEVLLHTGQHYDHGMSQVFFDELDIPLPDVNLGVGSGSHGRQTAEMLIGIEEVLLRERPDWVLVYGDTNSTLAGALAAAKLHIPVAHVEAGLRSYNRHMPEEVNRVLTDHVSDLLFCPTQTAVDNLTAEGVLAGVHNVGDVMYDAVRYNTQVAASRSHIVEELGVCPRAYLLATVHRPRNTDQPARLRAILEAFETLGEPIVLPAHPRTRKAIADQGQRVPPNVRLVEPLGYLDMLRLETQARAILTDSGGVQKEAYFVGVPCITLREETEWVETVELGWNRLVGAEGDKIVAAVRGFGLPDERPPVFGDGHAAERLVAVLTGGDKDQRLDPPVMESSTG